MKKRIKALLLSSMIIGGAQADFLMTLTDKDGVETSKCVKSYSFSNNLESLHKKNANYVDEYSSTKEVLTNKTWEGKPVYRRVFKDLSGFIENNKWQKVMFDIDPNIVDELVDAEVKFRGSHEHYTLYEGLNQFRYSIAINGLAYISNNGYIDSSTRATVVYEYTKVSDTAQTKTNETDSYVHYIPSSSTSNELLSVSLNETGIRFLNNYTYDSTTDSCNAPTN